MRQVDDKDTVRCHDASLEVEVEVDSLVVEQGIVAIVDAAVDKGEFVIAHCSFFLLVSLVTL